MEDHVLQLDLLYEFANDVTQLEVDSTLFQITQPGHQHLVSVNLDGVVHEGVLNAGNQSAVFKSDGSNIYLHTLRTFIVLGIITSSRVRPSGVSRRASDRDDEPGSLIKIVTSFTIAHSITLALSTFNIVVLPSPPTQSLIPLTIGYVAIENMMKKKCRGTLLRNVCFRTHTRVRLFERAAGDAAFSEPSRALFIFVQCGRRDWPAYIRPGLVPFDSLYKPFSMEAANSVCGLCCDYLPGDVLVRSTGILDLRRNKSSSRNFDFRWPSSRSCS